jgi:hypothetical protein
MTNLVLVISLVVGLHFFRIEQVCSYVHSQRRISTLSSLHRLQWLKCRPTTQIRSGNGLSEDATFSTATGSPSIASSPSPLSITTSPLLFSDAVFDKIASRVQEQVSIPMVPTPIVNYCLTRALQRMGQDLSPALLGKVEDVLAAEATSSKLDDLSVDECNLLADQIAKELTEKGVVDVPMLNAQQEYEILSQIFRIVMAIVTTSDEERRLAFIESTQLVAQDLLSTSPERRRALVTKLNDRIDLPLLGEEQEAQLLTKAVDMFANALSTLLPPTLIHSLKGESQDSLAEFKEFVIAKVNEKVDLIGLSEDQESSLIRTMIDLLIESYVDPTATNLLRLKQNQGASDPRAALQRQVQLIQRDIDLSRVRFEREQANLQSQRDALEAQILALDSSMSEMENAAPSYD